MESLKKALIFLLQILYPKQCLICGKLEQDTICSKCYNELKIEAKVENYKGKSFKEHLYIFKYEGKIRNLIIDYKFNDKPYLNELFAKIILKNEKICRKIKKYDIIIPVPIHKKRKNERGYNQSELIAKKVAQKLNIELVTDSLVKHKNTLPQSTLTKKQREENAKQVYKIQNKQKIQNKKIILLDDIYTTGATTEECTKILKLERCKRNISINNSKGYNKLEVANLKYCRGRSPRRPDLRRNYNKFEIDI